MNFFTRWFRRFSQPVVNRTSTKRRCRLEVLALEERALPSASLYAIDGTGNNLANPALGSAGTDLLRVSPVAYADGISSPSLPSNPSARVVSDELNNQASPANPTQDIQTVDQNNLSDFGYAWGQFLDHDMDLTTTNANELLTILADPQDPSDMGNQTFERSTYDPATGTSTADPRQQVNSVTSYLDLSQVYGSSAVIADALRTHVGGLLKTSPGNMLPYDSSTYFTPAQLAAIDMANDAQAVPTTDLFVTGDVRGNENVELTALQTLFVRNHNQIAAELQQKHPDWTDEQLYQEARKLNIAEYQEITYNYYLPDLLGVSSLPKYTGYQANVDPAIATEFSTVAFRFGHSLLSSGIERQGNNGQDVLPNDPAGADIDLATDFFDPNVLNPAGVVDPVTGHTSTDIDPILKGDADGLSQADDLLAISDIRDLLFANGGLTDDGQDLIARDVERARDDGIGTYNQVRVAYGLPAVTSFAQITSDVQVQNELKAVYGSVNNIDPFEGGLAESHVPGSDMGPLFTRILVDQFTRLRNGDRLFYLNQTFSQEETRIIQQGNTLAKVIEANTHITNLQSDVFLFKASISGTVTLDGAGQWRMPPPRSGLAGIAVQLKDEGGNVLGTTFTDANGHYFFNQQSGVSSTGTYTVALLVPAGFTLATANTETISIDNGSASAAINFTLDHGGLPKRFPFDVMLPVMGPLGQEVSFDITPAFRGLGFVYLFGAREERCVDLKKEQHMLNFFAKIFGRNSSKTRNVPKARQRQVARLWVEELTPRILPCAGPAGMALGNFAGGAAGLSATADTNFTGGDRCHHGSHEAAFTATLTDTGGATGSAQFNPTSGSLTIQVKGATTSTALSVAIGGTTVGTITTDASGNGKTTITESSSAIAAGTGITVGDLSGTFVQVQFTAALTGATGVSGTGKYNVAKNVLHVSITGAAAATNYNVTVDTTVVGQITTDSTGAGKLKVTLPSSVAIQSGSTLSVADTTGDAPILTGAFV